MGALTSQPYRFRARPWDIEGAGSVCTLCPAQCNVTFTVRDERVLRVLGARQRRGRRRLAVRQGPLRLPGRSTSTSASPQPLVRDGGELRPVSWERALDEAAAGARRAPAGASARSPAARRTNEEGFLLQRLMREGLGSPDLDSRAGGTLPLELHRALARARRCRPTVPDLEFAHAVLVLDCEPVDDAPILDLRIRKGVRRHGVKLAVATSRPSSLDPNAAVERPLRARRRRGLPAGALGRAATWAGAPRPSASRRRAGADADARARAGARCCRPARTS